MIFFVRIYRINISDCEFCFSGRYCQNRGAIEVIGMCKVGYICYGLVLYNDLVYNNDTSGNKIVILWGDICYSGYYCLEGILVMVFCFRGIYNLDRSGILETVFCKLCDFGKYCNGIVLIEVIGQFYFLQFFIFYFVIVLVQIFIICVRIY